MRKPAIPAVPNTETSLYNVLTTLKESVEVFTGVRGGQIRQLSSGASLPEVVAKVNEIIVKLNASGS
jgi:hypothetical protein